MPTSPTTTAPEAGIRLLLLVLFLATTGRNIVEERSILHPSLPSPHLRIPLLLVLVATRALASSFDMLRMTSLFSCAEVGGWAADGGAKEGERVRGRMARGDGRESPLRVAAWAWMD